MRRWKLASLATFLPAAQVQKALDGCDRATPMERRDYAILMMLAKLGLGGEVANLTLDDIEWRASAMLVHAKGRLRARMPIPPDVGAAIVGYLRNGRPKRRVGGCSSLPARASQTQGGGIAQVQAITRAVTEPASASPTDYSHSQRRSERLNYAEWYGANGLATADSTSTTMHHSESVRHSCRGIQ